MSDDLNWRSEQACREAWPAAVETVFDGWLLRRSGGRIRRSNSVNPLRGKRGTPESVLDVAEAFYLDHGQTPLFRVPDIAAEMDTLLDRRGYDFEGGTIHLYGGIDELVGYQRRARHRVADAERGLVRGAVPHGCL